jgi:DNA-binding NarL/FixJ family response regulator
MNQAIPLDPIRVIVVDNYSLYRTALCKSLSAMPGISIISEAANGKELLDLLENYQPDIVVMDIQMPVVDGLEALPVIRRKYPAVKVLILSMHSDCAVIRKMIELGANGYLTKDAGSAEIYEVIMGLQKVSLYVNETLVNALYKSIHESPEQRITGFTETEYKIFQLLLQYTTLKDISYQLDLSERTLSLILTTMKHKMDTESLPDMITKAEEKIKKLTKGK